MHQPSGQKVKGQGHTVINYVAGVGLQVDMNV